MTQSSGPSRSESPRGDGKFLLLSYTLQVRAPIEWDDEMSTAAASMLRDTVEPTLAAIKHYVVEAHEGLELEITT